MAVNTEPSPLDQLAQRTAGPGARILYTDAAALCIGDALILPDYNQLTALSGQDRRIIARGIGGTVYSFNHDAWMWVLRADWKAMPCPGCDRTWLDGCEELCDARTVDPYEIVTALAAMGLLAPGIAPPEM